MRTPSVHRSGAVSLGRLRRARRRRLIALAFVVSVATSFVAGEKVGARFAAASGRGREHLATEAPSSRFPSDAPSGNRELLEVEGSSGIGWMNTQLK